jgi:hypothetical protein
MRRRRNRGRSAGAIPSAAIAARIATAGRGSSSLAQFQATSADAAAERRTVLATDGDHLGETAELRGEVVSVPNDRQR